MFATITTRDFFGGRTILEGDYDYGEDAIYYMKPSKFRIVAVTALVRVYVITKYQLSFLLPSLSN
jgi:hypothetical protein